MLLISFVYQSISDVQFSKYSPILYIDLHFVNHLFFCVEAFELDKPHLLFCTGSLYCWYHIPTFLANTLVKKLFLQFYNKTFMASGLIFKSVVHF